MGHLYLVAPCFACGEVFASNPDLVPSYQNQPICAACVEAVNPQRVANGLDPIVIRPGAYEPTEGA